MQVKNQDVTIDDMTPALWREMSGEDRRDWTRHWRRQGQVSFVCLRCGFPTAFGTVGCEACRPESGRG